MSSSAKPSNAGRAATQTAGDIRPTGPQAPGQFAFRRLMGLGAVTVQLLLLTLIVRTFDIESSAFFRLMTIASVGFVVHHFTPARLRMPAFVLISFAAIALILGVSNAAQIIGLGLVVIGVTRLPIGYWWRVAVIVALGAVLAGLRVGAVATPLSVAIWPIFGAMFMFRLIVYLYDMRNKAAPFGLWRSMAYFFMLPNVCFPLFPVVDYKSFCRTYYDEEDIQIYQTGAEWIFRGVIQLLIYRWIYQHAVGPESVKTALGAALFVVTAYLMYLKISGSFHIVVGILHLFGFNLGRTNNKYLLSESFTDYWRRINIYWKDFLQKVFFNPIYFRLNRKWNATASLVAATLAAFLVTWALHSYQWFWIRGKFPVVWQDIVYWSIMGLLVLGNMLYENRYGRQRSLKKVKHSLASEARLAARTVGTFVVICLSWVVWSSESFGEVKMVVGRLLRADAGAALWIFGSLAGLGVIAVFVARADRARVGTGAGLLKRKAPAPIWQRAYRVTVLSASILFIAYAPLVITINPAISNTVDNLKVSRLNARDAQTLDRGYYEDLTNVVRFNSALGDLYNQRPPNWERCWAMHPTSGYPDFELMPNKKVWFKGAEMSTNRWGMRDRDYDKTETPGAFRIAILGASHTMGTGVGDDEVFDNVVEDRLNREHTGGGETRYELLNFSVGGYGPLQTLADLDRRVLAFQFDALLFTGIDDMYWMVKDVVDAGRNDFPVPYDYIQGVIREAGIDRNTSFAEGVQRLKPRNEELVRWVYGEVVRRCREKGAVPMVGYIPHPKKIEADTAARVRRQMELAREAGLAVIDMTGAYQGRTPEDITIAPWDSHPNALGHRLLADELYDGLRSQLGLAEGKERTGS